MRYEITVSNHHNNPLACNRANTYIAGYATSKPDAERVLASIKAYILRVSPNAVVALRRG